MTADQLLVRTYNVGVGDCTYLRVPDGHKYVHILIDCGNRFSTLAMLADRITQLKAELPNDGQGRKRLDLVIASHPGVGHVRGFEPSLFTDIRIGRIWLSPAFDRANPMAQAFHALQVARSRALTILADSAVGEMKNWILELLDWYKEERYQTLCSELPGINGIQPQYVSADTPQAELDIFEDPAIKLKVLGPMGDTDRYYVGGDGLLWPQAGLAPQGLVDSYQALFQEPGAVEVRPPRNINALDFDELRGQLHTNSFALVEVAQHAMNNQSLVLLLEWHGRRLLFPSDAEWTEAAQGRVLPGKSNGSWNVMWQERKAELSVPLDFYKIGQCGSANATPWAPPDKVGKQHPINQILEALLPIPQIGKAPKAVAVVSTLRTQRWPSIPDEALMAELGRRVANDYVRAMYREEARSARGVPLNTPQPMRTDLEHQATGKPVEYIDFQFSPLERAF